MGAGCVQPRWLLEMRTVAKRFERASPGAFGVTESTRELAGSEFLSGREPAQPGAQCAVPQRGGAGAEGRAAGPAGLGRGGYLGRHTWLKVQHPPAQVVHTQRHQFIASHPMSASRRSSSATCSATDTPPQPALDDAALRLTNSGRLRHRIRQQATRRGMPVAQQGGEFPVVLRAQRHLQQLRPDAIGGLRRSPHSHASHAST